MKICLLVLLLLWMVTERSKAEGQSRVDSITKFIKTFFKKKNSGNGEASEMPQVDNLARSKFDTGREIDSKYINHRCVPEI